MQVGENKMELLFNERSLNGQFADIPAFAEALDNLMKMRQIAKRYRLELRCHRSCQNAHVLADMPLNKAIQMLDRHKISAIMGWLGRTGPYWEDEREHSANEYFESQEDIVTDSAIGECAFLNFSNRNAQLVSVNNSEWSSSPIEVKWHREKLDAISINIINHTSETTLEKQLITSPQPLLSWESFSQTCISRFNNLYFSKDTFTPLKGRPFSASVAKNFLDLLEVLSNFKASHEPKIGRTQVGHELYQKFFTGQSAWFTDSSETEKNEFKNEMTFPHPENPGELILAPYHGKVKTPQMRIHFTWPVSAEKKLYILYIGDKITKK